MRLSALYFCFFLFLTNSVNSQTVRVQASVNKNRILIGEPFWLTIEIKAADTRNLQPFKIDSLAHFEILTTDSMVTTQEGGVQSIKQYYQLTSFDSGRWVIPPVTLRPNVKTSSILMDVVFSEPFDPLQPYHDIQDIHSIKFQMGKDFEKWWYGITLTLILITLITFWLSGMRKTKNAEIKASEHAYHKARRLMEALKKRKPDPTTLYIGMVDIFRGYIFEKTGIQSLHNTSTNLLQTLQPVFKNKERYQGMAQVLRLGDHVKFAKYQPTEKEAATALDVTAESIKHIEEVLKETPPSLVAISDSGKTGLKLTK